MVSKLKSSGFKVQINICLYRNLLRMAIPIFVNADNVVEYF